MEQIMALLAQQNSGRQNNQAAQQQQRQNQQQAFANSQQNQNDQTSSLLPELLRQLQSNAQPQSSLLLQLQRQTGGLQAPTGQNNDSSNPSSQPSLASAARRLLEQRDATQQGSQLACHGSPQVQQLQQSHANLGDPSLADVLELLQRGGGGSAALPPVRTPVAVPSNPMLSPTMMAALQQLAQSRTSTSGNTQGAAQAPAPVQSPALQSLPTPQRDTSQDLLTSVLLNALGNTGGLQNSSIATLLAELGGGQGGGQRTTEGNLAASAAAALPTATSATSGLPNNMADISDFVRMHLQQQQQQQSQPTAQRPAPQQQSVQQQQQNPVAASAPSPPVMASAPSRVIEENPNRASYPLNDITNPGQHDVLFGRGSGASNHLGNIRYRMLITQYKPRYNAASRVDKPKVADEIVHIWRNLSPPGRFLERCDSEEIEEDDDYTTGRWKDVGDKRAKTKTCQCLREKERPRNMRGPNAK